MESFKLKELKIEVTYKCPLACVHCSSDANINNNLAMDRHKCFGIIQEAVNMGVNKIAISGGEPLLWEGLDDIIEFCHLSNIQTTIYTSGNCDYIEEKMKNLASKGLDRAVFSLYSSEEIKHVRITRKIDSYQMTISAIKEANANGIETEIHFVAMKTNFRDLSQIAEFSKSIGVEKISVLRFVPQGRGKLFNSEGVLSKNENMELRKIIIELRNRGYDIRTGSPWNVLWLSDNPRCMAAQDRMIIAPDLRIYPCDAFKQVEYEKFSPEDKYSVIVDKSLDECWRMSDYFNKIRERQNSTPEQPCLDCDKYADCKSGCLAQKYIYYGELNKNPDPICIRGII